MPQSYVPGVSKGSNDSIGMAVLYCSLSNAHGIWPANSLGVIIISGQGQRM